MPRVSITSLIYPRKILSRSWLRHKWNSEIQKLKEFKRIENNETSWSIQSLLLSSFTLLFSFLFFFFSPQNSQRNWKTPLRFVLGRLYLFGGVLFCLKSNLEPSGAKGCFQKRNRSALYGPKRKDFDPKNSRGFLTESYFRPEKITFWVKRFMQFFFSKIFIVLVVPNLLNLHSNIPKMLQKS
jgi:hypothetical protein